jgi:tricorn protease
MPTSGGGDFSPGERQIVYSPLARDFRTWKRYQGGWAQDLYIYDLATARTQPVAHSPRTERDPMWIGNQIYFASDRDGTLNLYAYDIESKKIEQLTKSTTWDVRWPSKGEERGDRLRGGGELHVFDTKSKSDKKLMITVPNDGVAMRPRASPRRRTSRTSRSAEGRARRDLRARATCSPPRPRRARRAT